MRLLFFLLSCALLLYSGLCDDLDDLLNQLSSSSEAKQERKVLGGGPGSNARKNSTSFQIIPQNSKAAQIVKLQLAVLMQFPQPERSRDIRLETLDEAPFTMQLYHEYCFY